MPWTETTAPQIFLPMAVLLSAVFLGYLLGRWTGLARGQVIGQSQLILKLKGKALVGTCPVCGEGRAGRK